MECTFPGQGECSLKDGFKTYLPKINLSILNRNRSFSCIYVQQFGSSFSTFRRHAIALNNSVLYMLELKSAARNMSLKYGGYFLQTPQDVIFIDGLVWDCSSSIANALELHEAIHVIPSYFHVPYFISLTFGLHRKWFPNAGSTNLPMTSVVLPIYLVGEYWWAMGDIYKVVVYVWRFAPWSHTSAPLIWSQVVQVMTNFTAAWPEQIFIDNTLKGTHFDATLWKWKQAC